MNFIRDNFFLFGLALISGGALLMPGLIRRGAKASPLKATQLINQGKALILDVREPAEFAAGHLPDSRNIDLLELPKKFDELGKFKTKPVIVICKSGIRSSKAASLLGGAGFTEVFSLDGGMDAWLAQGLPVVK